MPPPPTTAPSPPDYFWALGWSESFALWSIMVLLFIIVMFFLIRYFLPTPPGEQPSSTAKILTFIVIIIGLAMLILFYFLP